MAKALLAKFKLKSPQELVAKAHQAFVRLPYESTQDRIVEELGRLLAGIKVIQDDVNLGTLRGTCAEHEPPFHLSPALGTGCW
jgi:hypothetical protein